MTEQIGKITLNYSRYLGEDLYCDGPVEDELLEIAKNYSRVEYPRLIEEKGSWPVLYHLSSLRQNIIDWIPMNKNMKVLEIGSGCGAITGALAKKAGSVACVELSKKRSMINAYRNMDCDNVTIHVGNFKDIEPDLGSEFDYICLIGVFEYGQSYMGTANPYEDFLAIMKKHLAPGGRMVIAIENKLGLKYFAGCQEDHLGTWFSGIENYPEGGGVRTFTRKGLERIFKSCGVEQYHFYYPYPDYKFMTTLYSDAYLPGKGELCNNLRNFDRDRMVLFDEKNAYDGLVEDGLFPLFSNSFLVVIGDRLDVKYAKYSNDRAPEYAIRTEIARTAEGEIRVSKHPLTAEANAHIQNMAVAYEKLCEKYQGSGLNVNRCSMAEGDQPCAVFEFVQGRPLSELLDKCLQKGDMEGFYALFREYVDKIGFHPEVPVSDFDMAFSNILVGEKDWTVIDYEWTFGKEIATKELAFRAIYCYLLENEKRDKFNLDLILEELGVSQSEAEQYREQEMDFQKFVTGNQKSMAEIRDLIGYRLFTPQKWAGTSSDASAVRRVQIYEDRGQGYKEEESYFLPEAYQGENRIEFRIQPASNVKALRIDPAMTSCMVKIKEMTFNGAKVALENRRIMAVNGKTAKGTEPGEGPSVVFSTQDPNINIFLEGLSPQPENELYVNMEIVMLPPAMAADMAGAVKKLI